MAAREQVAQVDIKMIATGGYETEEFMNKTGKDYNVVLAWRVW